MPTLTIQPSNASLANNAPRVLKIQFGNGYEQRAVDGINSNLRTWELEWNPAPAADIATLDAMFLAAKGTDLITWTQPAPYAGEGAKTFIVEEWQVGYTGGAVGSVRATLMQRPNV